MSDKDTQFKPGNKFGKGRPVLPITIIEIRKQLKDQYLGLIHEMVNKKLPELEVISADKEQPAFRVIIARVVLKSAQEHDPNRLEILMNRAIGRVKEEYVLEIKEEMEFEAQVGKMTTPELIAYTQKLIEEKRKEISDEKSN